MNDGAKKPEFQPPKLGDEMERNGLVYDKADVSEVVPRGSRQKRTRNRNKNNRRDHNRSSKETRMSNEGTAMNGTDGAKHERELITPQENYIRELTTVMAEHLKEQRSERGELRAHFKQIGDTLSSFNEAAKELTEGMEAVAARSREAYDASTDAASASLQVPEKLNEVKNLDNLKGDVRRAVVQTIVTAAVTGIALLAIALFGKKTEPVNEPAALPTALPKKAA